MTVFKVNNRPTARTWNGLVNDLFSDFENNLSSIAGQANANVPVNISETDQAYLLELAAPGRSKENFSLKVENNMLTISNEVKNETSEATKESAETPQGSVAKQLRKEFSYKSFKRSFSLDEKVNADGIEAKYENGILKVTLPKKEEKKPEVKQISIQ